MNKIKLIILISTFISAIACAQLVDVPVEFSDDSWSFQLNELKCRYRLPRFFVCSKGEDVEWDIVLPGKGKTGIAAGSFFVYKGSSADKILLHRLIQDFSTEEQQLIIFDLALKKIQETKVAPAPMHKLKPVETKEGKFIFGAEELTLPAVL